MSLDSVSSILQVVLVNAVLSGDNAIVIALVARNLPPGQRRRAMLCGSALAIVMRLLLTFVVSGLLLVPGLRFSGAILLAYIACKLIVQEDRSARHGPEAPDSIKAAIARIVFADAVMSLDNVIAVAGVSQSDPFSLIAGLALSITLILTLSSAIVAIMERQRWIVYAGTGILALAAATMVERDLDHLGKLAALTTQREGTAPLVGWPLRFVLVSICLTSRSWWPKARPQRRSAARIERPGASPSPLWNERAA
jgi:YjbE family integral membrane protein